jgi:1-acyl-sn-glycerol-3-phosphate acyltransferase
VDVAAGRPAGRRARWRYRATRLVTRAVVGAYLRIDVHGRSQLPRGPYLLCFNHLNWVDPFLLLSVAPPSSQLFFFGPKEEDMRRGWRNRLMTWTGTPIPFRPGRDDLLGATRRVQAVFELGAVLGIAGEGRIHRGESELLPLQDGVAFFALRSHVPIVPCAINGTSWLCFGRRVRIRFGTPIAVDGRPTQAAVRSLATRVWGELHALCQGYPDPPPPGRFGRWLTELFNEWPEDERPAGATPA